MARSLRWPRRERYPILTPHARAGLPPALEVILATGTLRLLSAAHFGGSESADVDMALLRDAAGVPLVPGSTVAGCARAYLAKGFAAAGSYKSGISAEPEVLRILFGDEVKPAPRHGGPQTDTAEQSLLFIDDVYFGCEAVKRIARRNGVRIDPIRGTALEQKLYDFEVLEAGTTAPIRLELVLRAKRADTAQAFVEYFQATLDALSSGGLTLGARTRRGLGMVRVEDWHVLEYAPGTSRADALAWISGAPPTAPARPKAAASAPERTPSTTATLTLQLRLASSVLVRAVPPELESEADAVQFKERDGKALRSLIPGSSWTGVLRQRALRILNTVAVPGPAVVSLLDGIFGPLHQGKSGEQGAGLYAGRISVRETPLRQVQSTLQTRIRINRITGGVTTGGLFEEVPDWAASRAGANLTLQLSLEEPQPAEIALLLLLAKDLWTADLAVGGGAGVGRGALLGVKGELRVGSDAPWTWETEPADSLMATRIGRIRFTNGDPNTTSAVSSECGGWRGEAASC